MAKKRHITLFSRFFGIAVCLLFVACQSDDSNFEDLLERVKKEKQQQEESMEKPMEMDFSPAPFEEAADQVPAATDPTYNDYVESFTAPETTVKVVFSEGNATYYTSGKSITITKNGAHVTANLGTKTAKFILSGNCSDGSLTITGEKRLEIALQGLKLRNPNGAVINCLCKKTLYLDCEASTENFLTSETGTATGSEAKACLFSDGQIAFSGSGYLEVNSAYRNAIASDDYIFIRPKCRMKLTCSSGNGIKANDGVKINGGAIDIFVSYNGGKGINCEDTIKVNGGRTRIQNDGTTRLDQVPVTQEFPQGIDTVSCAGVKCDKAMIVSAGEVWVRCSGNDTKGIKTSQDYTQTGGQVKVVSLGNKALAAPKGIKSNAGIKVRGGYLYSYSSHSDALDADGGIEAYAYKKKLKYLVEIGE